MFKKIAVITALAGVALGAQAQTNLLRNGSFEATSNGSGYCYLGNVGCTLQSWAGTAPVMASNNGAWGNPSGIANWNASFGAEQIGIQNSTFVEQSLTLAAGTYSLTWFDAKRVGYNDQSYNVFLNGVSAGNFVTAGSSNWQQRTLTFTTTAAGTEVIRFAGVAGYAQDGTSFIDNVALVSDVPEPSTTALMMVGALALVARRRRIAR